MQIKGLGRTQLLIILQHKLLCKLVVYPEIQVLQPEQAFS